MDLARSTNERKLHVCKWYFIGECRKQVKFKHTCLTQIHIIFFQIVGFFLLPFVWTINAFWFFDEAFRKPAYKEQKKIRTCK